MATILTRLGYIIPGKLPAASFHHKRARLRLEPELAFEQAAEQVQRVHRSRRRGYGRRPTSGLCRWLDLRRGRC